MAERSSGLHPFSSGHVLITRDEWISSTTMMVAIGACSSELNGFGRQSATAVSATCQCQVVAVRPRLAQEHLYVKLSVKLHVHLYVKLQVKQ